MPSPQAVTAARVTAALKPALSDAVAAAIVADSADPASFVAECLLKCPAQTTSEQPTRPSESESPSSEPAGGMEDLEPDRDRADVPRPQPTTELLLPAGWPATFHDRFSLLVSRHAFDGWAAQPSPCCGAASVAGACNAALGLAHDAPLALTHLHVAALYHRSLIEKAAKCEGAAARLLRVPSLAPALDALRAALQRDGLSLGGRKEQACKGKAALLRLRAVCEEHVTQAPAAAEATEAATEAEATEAEAATTPAEAERQMWTELWDVLLPVRGPALGEVGAASSQAQAQGGAAEGEGGPEGEGEEKEDEPVAGDDFGGKVRTEIKALLSRLGGAEQLAPTQPRLCTFFVGNWGMHSALEPSPPTCPPSPRPHPRLEPSPGMHLAVRELASSVTFDADADADADADPRLVSLRGGGAARAALCARLRCRTLVGIKVKGQVAPPILLRKADSAERVEEAWGAFKAAFSAPRTCLLLHQKNHYSLVFALREWTEPPPAEDAATVAANDDGAPREGRRVRELLTCRKGQRPTVWIDWTEVHRCISGWSGYAVMQISAPPAAAEM